MKGETQIEFEFDFEFTEAGRTEKSNSITVRAPGYRRIELHDKMVALVNEALIGLVPKIGDLDRSAGAVSDGEPAAGQRDALMMLAMGLGNERFPGVMTMIRKQLTNAPDIAFVTGSQEPVTDLVWESLADGGGVEAVNQVVSTFVDFFMPDLVEASPAMSLVN